MSSSRCKDRQPSTTAGAPGIFPLYKKKDPRPGGPGGDLFFVPGGDLFPTGQFESNLPAVAFEDVGGFDQAVVDQGF